MRVARQRSAKRVAMRQTVLALAAAFALLGAAPSPRATDVAIETGAGTIVVRLDPAHAPRTVANFLRYVDARRYDGAEFYRTVRAAPGDAHPPRIQVIQGGLEHSASARMLAPIAVESTRTTGLHNVPGSIAMARTNDPNSATSEFFINLADDTWLDGQNFPDGQGYAVFGRVVRGFDVVRTIQQSPARGEELTPPIRIVRIRRV
ncbi:MAG: peptidylprolyl isomerase [Candidatus Eremiobacteraeota bacterium]|nr:peptidylprolyl isomerase [Candidatus Eremiobacteraeota bacterium]